jgi:ATP-dependent DNA ligase
VPERLHERFPKLIEALASLGGDFVFDGELMAFDSQGRPQTLRKVSPVPAIVRDPAAAIQR